MGESLTRNLSGNPWPARGRPELGSGSVPRAGRPRQAPRPVDSGDRNRLTRVPAEAPKATAREDPYATLALTPALG